MNNGSDRERGNGSSDDGRDINPVGDLDVDEYELYYGESAVKEPVDEAPVKRGPLSRRPLFSSAIPFLFFSILFLIFTFPLNHYYFPDNLWASREAVFTNHQYWRLVSAIFTHADTVHLLSNMPLFCFFGLFLYEYFGFVLFPVLSLLVGAAANAVTLYFYPETLRIVGASGMLYGMVSLWLVLYVYHDTDHTVPVRIFRSTGFTLIMMFPETYNPETSYLVHAAGFFIGIICALAVLPVVKVKERNGSEELNGNG